MKFLSTVQSLNLFPYIYNGIVNIKHASWIPPSARNTRLLPSSSSQRLKKREKMKPCRTSRYLLVSSYDR